MLKIEKGKQWRPPKVVIYGPEGVGKTTLAAKFPRPLFVDFEGGSSRLDVDRIQRPGSLAELKVVIDDLRRDHGDYRTLVLDTADWMEQLVVEQVCADRKVKDLGEIAYGQGYNIVAGVFADLLDSLTRLQAATQMGVVFCAHALQRKVDNPEQMSQYDHWELKLSKKASPLLKEWCDFLLFYKFETDLIKEGDKVRAVGQSRIICSGHTAWYDAKSREATLKPTIKTNDAGIEHLLACIFQTVDPREEVAGPAHAQETPKPVEEQPVLEGKAEPQPEPQLKQEFTPKQSKLCDLMIASGVKQSELAAMVSRMGILMAVAAGDLHNYNDATCDKLISNWDKVQRNINKMRG